MGVWGFKVLHDDTAADVYQDFVAEFNRGFSLTQIMRSVRKKHAASLSDSDEAPVVWLAIAQASWECGNMTTQVRDRVDRIIKRGEGLGRWADEGPKAHAKRKAALESFLNKLNTVNTKPRNPKLPVQRKAVFAAGDCLSIRLNDGRFAAAVVLAADSPEVTHGKETYGINLIGQLNFLSHDMPTRGIFEARDWFTPTHHDHALRSEQNVVYTQRARFRQVQDRFVVVDQTPLRIEDPQDSRCWTFWDFAEQIIFQEAWDNNVHNATQRDD